MKILAIFLVALLLSVPAIQAQNISAPTGNRVAQSSESRQVWVNTATGVYHYPGTRWYGNTKQGKFMSEADARAQGCRPAMNGQRNLFWLIPCLHPMFIVGNQIGATAEMSLSAADYVHAYKQAMQKANQSAQNSARRLSQETCTNYRSTIIAYHRDGTVTFWDVSSRAWVRTANPTDQQLKRTA
jgi:hypothetical protein